MASPKTRESRGQPGSPSRRAVRAVTSAVPRPQIRGEATEAEGAQREDRQPTRTGAGIPGRGRTGRAGRRRRAGGCSRSGRGARCRRRGGDGRLPHRRKRLLVGNHLGLHYGSSSSLMAVLRSQLMFAAPGRPVQHSPRLPRFGPDQAPQRAPDLWHRQGSRSIFVALFACPSFAPPSSASRSSRSRRHGPEAKASRTGATPPTAALRRRPAPGANPSACSAGGGPGGVRLATKPKLARRMLERSLDAVVPCAWIMGDAVYGSDHKLRV